MLHYGNLLLKLDMDTISKGSTFRKRLKNEKEHSADHLKLTFDLKSWSKIDT